VTIKTRMYFKYLCFFFPSSLTFKKLKISHYSTVKRDCWVPANIAELINGFELRLPPRSIPPITYNGIFVFDVSFINYFVNYHYWWHYPRSHADSVKSFVHNIITVVAYNTKKHNEKIDYYILARYIYI